MLTTSNRWILRGGALYAVRGTEGVVVVSGSTIGWLGEEIGNDDESIEPELARGIDLRSRRRLRV